MSLKLFAFVKKKKSSYVELKQMIQSPNEGDFFLPPSLLPEDDDF